MKLTAERDYILLERQATKTKSEFIGTDNDNDSPFFVVVHINTIMSNVQAGDIVMPRPGTVIVVEDGDKKYYWVKVEDIMGVML
jgi:co-chaperonin GroES (HSP10)